MQLSARNQIPGTIVRIKKGIVTAEVIVRIAGGHEIASVITVRIHQVPQAQEGLEGDGGDQVDRGHDRRRSLNRSVALRRLGLGALAVRAQAARAARRCGDPLRTVARRRGPRSETCALALIERGKRRRTIERYPRLDPLDEYPLVPFLIDDDRRVLYDSTALAALDRRPPAGAARAARARRSGARLRRPAHRRGVRRARPLPRAPRSLGDVGDAPTTPARAWRASSRACCRPARQPLMARRFARAAGAPPALPVQRRAAGLTIPGLRPARRRRRATASRRRTRCSTSCAARCSPRVEGVLTPPAVPARRALHARRRQRLRAARHEPRRSDRRRGDAARAPRRPIAGCARSATARMSAARGALALARRAAPAARRSSTAPSCR